MNIGPEDTAVAMENNLRSQDVAFIKYEFVIFLSSNKRKNKVDLVF